MSKGLRVLVVEDNPADVDLIREYMADSGLISFQINSVSRLSEAIARLEGESYDLLLIDLGLPDSRGLETFYKVQTAAPNIPTIILTGYDDQEAAITAVRKGAQDYLIKGEIIGSVLVRAARYAVERKQSEESLRAAERKLKTLFEIVPLGISVLDADRKIVFSNPALETIAGLSREGLLREEYTNRRYLRADKTPMPAEEFASVRAVKEDKRVDNVETGILRKDGEVIWTNVSAVPVTFSDWKVVIVTSDITERKAAEEVLQKSLREKESLLQEIHHRVMNNMQIISSILHLQAGYIKDEEARRILKEGQFRIRSIALVHEKLYRSSDLSKIDFADYLQSLFDHLFQFFRFEADQIRLETDLERIFLDINSALPCALISNELVSNVLKHAFPEGRKGVIRIGLRREGDGTVELRIGDDGVGFPERIDINNADSFGLQIVNLLVGQLEGIIKLDRGEGTAFTVTFRELKNRPLP